MPLEHILFHVLDYADDIDRRFQRHPQWLIPQVEVLLANPSKELASGDIVIKPRRRYAIAAVFACMIGLISCCGVSVFSLEQPIRQHGPSILDRSLTIFLVVFFPLVVFFALNHWLSGAVMVLRTSGVVIRYRQDRIYLPWSLFAETINPVPLNNGNYSLIVTADPVEWIVHSRNAAIIAMGWNIRTRPVSFTKDGQLILRSMYQAKFVPLFEMLHNIGLKLNQDTSKPLPITTGMMVPEDMT